MKQLDLGLSIDVDKMDSELRYTEAVLGFQMKCILNPRNYPFILPKSVKASFSFI